jgi:chitin synthase
VPNVFVSKSRLGICWKVNKDFYNADEGEDSLTMASNNRLSVYSNTSSGQLLPRNVNSAAQQSQQVSTTTLLNAIHTIYTSSQPYQLDASTSLCVNTWLTASQPDHDGRVGGTVDGALASRAWEHARRRAEDGCILLGYEPLPSQT